MLCGILPIRTPFARQPISPRSTVFSIAAPRIHEQVKACIDVRHRGDLPNQPFCIEPAPAARDELKLDLLAIFAIEGRCRIGTVQR